MSKRLGSAKLIDRVALLAADGTTDLVEENRLNKIVKKMGPSWKVGIVSAAQKLIHSPLS